MIRFEWAALALALALAAGPALANDSGGYAPPAALMTDSGAMTRARAAIDARDYPSAIAILYKIVQAESGNADAANLLGFSYRMLGQYREAFYYYDKALALDPKHKGALEYEGEAYLETDQLPKAEANLASLKSACAGGCVELGQLQAAIDRYKAKTKIN